MDDGNAELDARNDITIDAANRTSLRHNLPEVILAAPDFVFYQEHSLPTGQQPAAIAHSKDHSVQLLLGRTEFERTKPTGVVCIAAL